MSTPASSLQWKDELNARLREHRERRGSLGNSGELEDGRRVPSGTASARMSAATPASRVAARVAERYRDAPSYRELLAASAVAAASAAEAAAEAAFEAHAAAEAVLSWEAPLSALGHNHRTAPDGESRENGDVFNDPFFTQDLMGDQRVSPDEAAEAPQSVKFAFSMAAAPVQSATVAHHAPLPERTAVPSRNPVAHRARSLVDAFAEAVVPAAQALPAKLIEFPRELIAPRKQRPRLAEGPLLEEKRELEPSGMPLRIFEVMNEGEGTGAATGEFPETAVGALPTAEREMPARQAMRVDRAQSDRLPVEREIPDPLGRRRHGGFHLGSAPSAKHTGQSGWDSIRLGEHPLPEGLPATPASSPARRPEHGYKVETAPALHDLAPIGDRLMAALVDGGLVLACFLLSVLVFASCTVHPPAGKPAIAVGLLVLGFLATFYGWLFMSFGGGSTPGMRYARIALCTFADENPSRKELQNRVPATALALLPLGLGVFWALLDEDKLGWHDRMTRTYQRSYR